jgi:hypothetical protein
MVLAPVAGVKSAKACRPNRAQAHRQFADDGGKTNSSPGRARHTPLKPFARGNAGCIRCLRCEYWCAYSLPPAHTRLRVHWAPGIPRALSILGRKSFWKTSGASRCESTNACPVIARSACDEAISFLFRGEMDCFANARNDGLHLPTGCLKFESHSPRRPGQASPRQRSCAVRCERRSRTHTHQCALLHGLERQLAQHKH